VREPLCERLTTVDPRQFVCVADLDSRIVGFICVFAASTSRPTCTVRESAKR